MAKLVPRNYASKLAVRPNQYERVFKVTCRSQMYEIRAMRDKPHKIKPKRKGLNKFWLSKCQICSRGLEGKNQYDVWQDQNVTCDVIGGNSQPEGFPMQHLLIF